MLYVLAVIAGILFLIKAADSVYNYFECEKLHNDSDVNVSIGESNIRLVADGEDSENTAVIIHGWGGAYPAAEFALLMQRLSEQMKVYLIERPGYGINTEIYNPRNIENVLDESRQALKAAGVSGKITLVAHSMGSLEAMLWVKKYPDEIKSVVYLDPCTPDFVRKVEIDGKRKTELALNVIFDCLGWSRIISYVNPKFFKIGRVGKENFGSAVAMLSCNGMSSAVINELSVLKTNAEKADEEEYPSDIPSLAVVSEKGLAQGYEDYLEKECSMRVEHFGKGHFIHCSSAEEVAEYILKSAI